MFEAFKQLGKIVTEAATTELALPLLDQALRGIFPVALTDSVRSGLVVVPEADLNVFLAKQLASSDHRKQLARVEVRILADDRLGLALTFKKIGFTLPTVTVPLRIVNFSINSRTAVAELDIVEPPTAEVSGWVQRVVGWVFKFLLEKLIHPSVLGDLAPDTIRVDGQRLRIDLRKGVLAPLYTKSLQDVSPVPLPVVGACKFADLIVAGPMTTAVGELRVGCKVMLGGGSEEASGYLRL